MSSPRSPIVWRGLFVRIVQFLLIPPVLEYHVGPGLRARPVERPEPRNYF